MFTYHSSKFASSHRALRNVVCMYICIEKNRRICCIHTYVVCVYIKCASLSLYVYTHLLLYTYHIHTWKMYIAIFFFASMHTYLIHPRYLCIYPTHVYRTHGNIGVCDFVYSARALVAPATRCQTHTNTDTHAHIETQR